MAITPSALRLPPTAFKPTWKTGRSFDWNARHGPSLYYMPLELPPEAPASIFGRRLRSPLGVAAGPLPNARFIEAYARLGYSILTYKSVRSRAWDAYPAPVLARLYPGSMPNPLCPAVAGARGTAAIGLAEELSSTNSVGLPSDDPREWREDVRKAHASLDELNEHQLLCVSVVGTPRSGGNDNELADDYALCVHWAVEAGADMVELNLSCPNVRQDEGEIYQDPRAASAIVRAARATAGKIPMSAKLGYYAEAETMEEVLTSIIPSLDALTLINAVRWQVTGRSGRPYFPGSGRELAGVGGDKIRELAQANIRHALAFLRRQTRQIPVIAVGGVTQPWHVDEYLDMGATVVEAATAAIWRPFLSFEYAAAQS